MNKKAEILALLDYALDLAEKYEVRATKVLADDELTDKGKDMALKTARDKSSGAILSALATASQNIRDGLAELQKRWDRQTASLFDDTTLQTAIQSIGISKPTKEALASLVERYKDNPSAVELIRQAVSGHNDKDLEAIIGRDYRAYNTDLLERLAKGLESITADDLDRFSENKLDNLTLELASRKEFIFDRLNDDLSLI